MNAFLVALTQQEEKRKAQPVGPPAPPRRDSLDTRGQLEDALGRRQQSLPEILRPKPPTTVKGQVAVAMEQVKAKTTQGKSLTQIAAKDPQSIVSRASQLRTSLKIKPGSPADADLKAVLANEQAKGGGRISDEQLARITELHRTGGLKREAEFLRKRNEDSRRRKAGSAEKLTFSEEAYKEALASGQQVFLDKKGRQIDFMEADQEYATHKLIPPTVRQKTDEQLAIESASSVGSLPQEGLRTDSRGFQGLSIADQEEALDRGVTQVAKDVGEITSPFLRALERATGNETVRQIADVASAPVEFATKLALSYPYEFSRDVSTVLDTKAKPEDRILSGMMVALDVVPVLADKILKGVVRGGQAVSAELKAIKGAEKALADALGRLPTKAELGGLESALRFVADAPEDALQSALRDPRIQRLTQGEQARVPQYPDRVPTAVEADAPVGTAFREAPKPDKAQDIPVDIPKSDVPPVKPRIEPELSGLNTQKTGHSVGHSEGVPAPKKSVVVPEELKGEVDETFLGKKADEWERRLAELQAKPKKPRGKESGGLDPDVLEEAVLRAGIAMARAGEPIEKSVRGAIRAMGLKDSDAREIEAALRKEAGLEAPKPKATGVGKTQAETAVARAQAGIPSYQKTRQTLEQTLKNAEGVDVARTVADVKASPRPMTAAEEAATLKAFNDTDKAYRDLSKQYNAAVARGDLAEAGIIEDTISAVQKQMEDLADASDLAGTEWGRAGRARQLEIQRSREPEVIRYRQYKAVGGKPSAADKKAIDDLVAQLEEEKRRVAELEVKVNTQKTTQARKRAQARLNAPRPARKVDTLIQENDKAFADWQKRWARVKQSGSQSGSTALPLAAEGAYYVAKGQVLRGVRNLDDIIKSVRRAGLSEKDISDADIAGQVSKAIDDTRPKRAPSKKETLKDLREQIAKATGRVREVRKAPKKGAAPKSPNTPAAKAEKRYADTLGDLQKETESLQAQVSLLRAADPTGEQFMKMKGAASRLSAKVNRGRAYGKGVLQVGDIGFQGDDVANLRNSLDRIKRDLGFDEQAVNAPGPSYENIIKNIEDLEARGGSMSPHQLKEELSRLYRELNAGRAEGEGFFRHGSAAIEDPIVAMARAREDAVMAKINREIARQKREAERGAMSTGRRRMNDFVQGMGAVKTLALSGEAGFIGRQAGTAILTGRFRTLGKASRDMLQSLRQRAFDYTLSELKSNPWYDTAQKHGLAITDPSTAIREEDFMADLFGDIVSRTAKKPVKAVAGGLKAYADLNERAYSSFLNRVRMDMFQDMAESVGKKGALTEKDLDAIASIVNDMTGRGAKTGSPEAEQAISVLNHLFISARYYLSRLRMVSGWNLATGTKASRALMAKEYAKMTTTYMTFLGTAYWANERFGLGWEVGVDSRATNFGEISFPNGVSVTLDSGMRPFVNYLIRNGIVLASDFAGKEGDDRYKNYVTGRGKEYDDRAHFANPQGLFASFIAVRSNPLPRLLLADFSKGEQFGNKTDVYKELATAPVPIQFRNAYERLYNKDPADAQAFAFLLEFFGLGGQDLDKKQDLRKERERDSRPKTDWGAIFGN